MNETTEITATEDPHLKDGWRPIATAPKNGARIWLFAPHIMASAIAMNGHAAGFTGISAGRWYEDEDFGCRRAGWQSPQFGWKQDDSEIMASNQDCYRYWKLITRVEELELAAIAGWNACMRSVQSVISGRWDPSYILEGIGELFIEGARADYEMTSMIDEFAARPTLSSWPATKGIVLPRDAAGRTPDPFAFVLGLAMQPWKTSGIANLLRDSGEVDIPTKAEAEMAAALHWLLGLVFVHGEYWEDPYSDEIARMRAIVDAKTLAAAS